MNEYKIGDRVILKYNGYPEVPHYLDRDGAEIVGFTKTKIKVKPDSYIGIKTVRFDQIIKI